MTQTSLYSLEKRFLARTQFFIGYVISKPFPSLSNTLITPEEVQLHCAYHRDIMLSMHVTEAPQGDDPMRKYAIGHA